MSGPEKKKKSQPRPKGKAGAKKKKLPQPKALRNTDTGSVVPTQTDEARVRKTSQPKRKPAPAKAQQDRFGATVTDNPSAPVDVNPAAGTTADDGRYEILRLIARGGMGEVWLGKDLKLKGRYVAIKRLTEESLNVSKLRKRFEAEAESMARLSHINVIRVFDIGTDEHGPFICMEYLSGPPRQVDGWAADLPVAPLTLQEHVESKGRLRLEESLQLMRGICGAVIAAHKLGIIHRDIKPANVLLSDRLEPKLIDFGLARDLEPEVSQHTVAGAQMLTIGYGAPEQEADASQADERADVYALGAVLWFMVSGQNPRFYRASETPEEIKQLLGNALIRDVDQRTQTVKELDDAIARVQQKFSRQSVSNPGNSDRASSQLTEVSQCLEAERQPGVCPFCSHVHDPIPTSAKKRQFCAGCGTSLWLKCRNCASNTSKFSLGKTPPLPLWERFCSKCGDDLLKPVLEHLGTAVKAMNEAHAIVNKDTVKAHDLARQATESLECLTRECGTDFSAGRVGQLCGEVQQEIEALHNSASVKAASNDEDSWKAADSENSVKAFQQYLKDYPTGVNAKEAKARLDVMLLAADVRTRLKAKSYATLLPDVGRLMEMSDAAKQKWPDEKLCQLLKKDHSFASCMAYLQIYPEGAMSVQAKGVVSPMLRKQVLQKMTDTDLRQKYLALRAPAEQEEDESRAFNTTLWLWGAIGAVIGLGVLAYGLVQQASQLVIGGMITSGSGLLTGILFSMISGRHSKFGPLPKTRYIIPTFSLPKKLLEFKFGTDTEVAESDSE